MIGAIVVGVDPGAVTGIAARNLHGLIFSAQGEPREMMRMLFGFIRANVAQIVDVGVEGVFVGHGAMASLSVAKAQGGIQTLLWVAGYDRPPWEPMPSEWRRLLDMLARVPDDEKPGKTRAANRKELEERARTQARLYADKHFRTQASTHEAEAVLICQATWLRWTSRQAMVSGNIRERT